MACGNERPPGWPALGSDYFPQPNSCGTLSGEAPFKASASSDVCLCLQGAQFPELGLAACTHARTGPPSPCPRPSLPASRL